MTTKTKAPVTFDYPQKSETITSREYTFRFSASGEVSELYVSIDGARPQPARKTAGYYWYDWANYPSGQHQITAMAYFHDGSYAETEPYCFRVENGGFAAN